MYEYISLLLADLLFFVAKALDSCQTNLKKDINLISKNKSGINLYQSLDNFCDDILEICFLIFPEK